MTGKTHLAIGTLVGAGLGIVTYKEGASVCGGVIGLTMLASILPDIDNRKSMISNKLKITSTITNKLFGHRGFFHSPFLVLLIYIMGTVLIAKYKEPECRFYLYAIIAGYSSHLFLDMLTKGGIPVLYPFNKKRFCLTHMKSGGAIEAILFFTIALVSVIVINTIFKIF